MVDDANAAKHSRFVSIHNEERMQLHPRTTQPVEAAFISKPGCSEAEQWKRLSRAMDRILALPRYDEVQRQVRKKQAPKPSRKV